MKDWDTETLPEIAMMIAFHVRNSMEDFHCEHLRDDQMAELNPIIRGAIYNALYAITHDEPRCNRLAAFLTHYPEYWERPVLDDRLKKEQL